MDDLCLEGTPPMSRNDHRLRRKPHRESLAGIGLNIKDLGDAVTKVLVLCKAHHHRDDGLVVVLLLLLWLDHPEVVGWVQMVQPPQCLGGNAGRL